MFTAWDHLSWSKINITFFHSSVIIKLFNNSNFKEWLQRVYSHWLLKGYSSNEHKGNFILNEWGFLKSQAFLLWQNFMHEGYVFDYVWICCVCVCVYVWKCVCVCMCACVFNNKLLCCSTAGKLFLLRWKLCLTEKKKDIYSFFILKWM